MYLHDWKRHISLNADETVYIVDEKIRFYPESKLLEEQEGVIILTNERIIFLIKEFKGILFKELIGYRNKYSITFSDIKNYDFSKRITAVKMKLNKKISGFSEFGFAFSDKDKMDDFMEEYNNQIMKYNKGQELSDKENLVLNYIRKNNFKISTLECSKELELSEKEIHEIIKKLQKKDYFNITD